MDSETEEAPRSTRAVDRQIDRGRNRVNNLEKYHIGPNIRRLPCISNEKIK
jgi:hypothetical protein